MREEELLVPRHDGGIVRAALTRGKNEEDVIIFLPGFGGTTRDALPYLVAYDFPEKQDHSVIRLEMFYPLNGRSLSDAVSLRDLVEDLVAVIDYVQQLGVGTRTVHCIAHSLSVYIAVITAAHMPTKLDSIVLWEPTTEGADLVSIYNLEQWKDDIYVSKDDYGLVINRSFVESVKAFRLSRYASRAAYVPALVVAAGAGGLKRSANAYAKVLSPARRIDIRDARHNLIADTEWTRELFAVTGEWLAGGYLSIE